MRGLLVRRMRCRLVPFEGLQGVDDVCELFGWFFDAFEEV